MTKEELETERNEVREILEDFSEELSQPNLDKLSRVFCIINGDEKRIAELEAQIEKMKCCGNCNGIFDGGRRAEKCRHCMDSKELSEWELAND